MAELYEELLPNCVKFVDVDGTFSPKDTFRHDETILTVLHRLISLIFFPDSADAVAAAPLLHRIKISLYRNGPSLREASKNTGRDILLWTRRGSALRSILVISVGTISLVAATGLLVFMLFFLAATFNAILISLFISLAAAGGFLALFFVCMAAIYIGALSIAVFVISTATICTIIAVLIATGWIGFFWTIWLATSKSVGLAKHSLSMTGSALSAYSISHHARHHHKPENHSD